MTTRHTIRLAAPIVGLSCLPLLLGAYAAWHLHRSQRAASDALACNVRSVRSAEELAIGIRDVRTRLHRYLLTADPAALHDVRRLRRETDRWLDEARRNAVHRFEWESIADLTRDYNAFFADLGQAGTDPAALHALADRVEDILRPAQAYLDFNEDEGQWNSEDNERVADRMALGLLLLGVCGPLTGVVAGYGIARAVNRSLVRLSIPVRDAAGKLNEVVGPVTVSAGMGLEEFEATLHRVADHTRTVVERLHRTQRDALRAEQLAAVGQMAAGLAHELRNPLMSMKLLVQSADDRAGGGALAGRDLAVLEEEITRLEQLTATFLDFARPQAPQKTPFVAQELLEGVAELVSGQAGQRDVRIECDLPAGPVWVDADAGQVRQVVLNLLLNALDAIGHGGTIGLRLESADPAGQWVAMLVTDTGPGLPRDLGQDIFAPFVSTKVTGIGLGLSVSKRLVEAHGGEIAAADRPGGGAVFSVRLPCAAHPPAPVPAP